jgi:hypothetical protein
MRVSRRLNLYGFSLPQMRGLLSSGNREALSRLKLRLRERPGLPLRSVEEITPVYNVIERAVMHGVPFSDLTQETYLHAQAFSAIAGYEQDWLLTDASAYHASALEVGLWVRARKYGSPEARAFIKGLAHGIPLFGNHSASDGSAYAAVGFDRLRAFEPHVQNLAETIEYQVNGSRRATEEDRAALHFANEFCGWLKAISSANCDLLLVYG